MLLYVTSDQNKVSETEVVDKVIPVANFSMCAVTCKKYENWWMYVKPIASQTWDIF